MKLSLLQIVQDVLNDLDTDYVNSINDTTESQQVAQIAKTCFFEIISNRNWPHLQTLIQLDPLSDANRPNYLSVPDNVKELQTFKYDKSKAGDNKIVYQDVIYKHPDEFLTIVSNRDSSNANTKVVTDFSGVKLIIYNNQPPRFWTSFNDKYIVTDSYDSSTESTHMKDKTQCVVYRAPSWTHADDAIPDLPEEAFSGYLEEVKSTAFLALKQMANQKAEQKAGRQQRWLSRKAWKTHGGVRYENYGRKARR